jgi:hypothetical protein
MDFAMRRLVPVLMLLSMLSVHPARAQGTPVVVELFTSQGCAACPPADALLTELDQLDGVIALALHVDYWDYLGWKDTFGRAAHTDRQEAYARAAGARSVYTPQTIVQGVERVMGTRPDAVASHIRNHRVGSAPVSLALTRSDATLDIRLAPVGAVGSGAAEVSVVRFTPREVVRIEHGENAGREIVYTNVVTGWDVVARWDGRSPAEFSIELGDASAVAVIVQRERLGPVLSAGMLR